MSNIPELEAEVATIRAELEAAEERLDVARVAATGIAVGDIVKGKGRLAGSEFKVARVDARWSNPWLEGVKRRADGSWGTGVRHLYENWERTT